MSKNNRTPNYFIVLYQLYHESINNLKLNQNRYIIIATKKIKALTVNVIILSKSIAGAMWKSNTKYWKRNNASSDVEGRIETLSISTLHKYRAFFSLPIGT